MIPVNAIWCSTAHAHKFLGRMTKKGTLKVKHFTLKKDSVSGQAVVQLALHKHSRQEVAIKYFLSKAAFQDEAAQYTDASNPHRQFLPKCLDIVEEGDARSVFST